MWYEWVSSLAEKRRTVRKRVQAYMERHQVCKGMWRTCTPMTLLQVTCAPGHLDKMFMVALFGQEIKTHQQKQQQENIFKNKV